MRTAVFRLYPEGGAIYVRVIVHPTKKAMKEHWRTSDVRFGNGRWGQRIAYCTERLSWRMDNAGRSRRDPCIAEVNMYRSRVGTEVVTHELFHATMAWARRVGFDFSRIGADDAVNDDEERISYVHGRLCRQFVDRAYGAGLYP